MSQGFAIGPAITVTGPLTDTQLRAVAVPVSMASVPSHDVTNIGTFAVQSAQSGAWTVGVNNFPAGFLAAQSGSWTVDAVQSGDWTITEVAVVTEITKTVTVAGTVDIGSMPPVSAQSTATATEDAPEYTEGDDTAAFSQDLAGNLRTRLSAEVSDTALSAQAGDVAGLSLTTDRRLRVATLSESTNFNAWGDPFEMPFTDREQTIHSAWN